MRLAILGTRGIPARYGGFETLAEELSARLAARGHDVTVYTRVRYAQPGLREHRGARIRVLPTVPTKYLDTVVHGLISAFDAALEGINRLKKVVPIWKKEHFADGEVWVDGEWDETLLRR